MMREHKTMYLKLVAIGLLIITLMPLQQPVHAQGGMEMNITMLAAGNNAFGFKLYQAVRAAPGNLFLSPYSIVEALSMTLNGAQGDTREQMLSALGFPLKPEDINPAILALRAGLEARGNSKGSQATPFPRPPRSLNIANALFGEQTLAFREPFLATVKSFYGAGLQKVDYIGAPETARKIINDWVAGQTRDKIKDIVPPGAITPDTRLSLANAIYFRNTWLKPFEAQLTKDDTFNRIDGRSVPVKMMYAKETRRYARGDGFEAIELPYSEFGSMLFIVPDAGQFEPVEKKLNAAILKQVSDSLTNTEVALFLPRFKFEYALEVSSTLEGLGMVDAFDRAKADFSGIADTSGSNRLYISNVLHKAFIDLNEDGTEAAAATVMIMQSLSLAIAQPIVMRVDRPFFFAIRDSQTGLVLFMGRVLDPSS